VTLVAVLAGPAGAMATCAAARNALERPTAGLPQAQLAKVSSLKLAAKLHLVEAIGETLVEAGTATGTLPGSARVRININAATDRATATFTLSLRGGSISGRAAGEAHEGKGSRESFSGLLVSSHGTGRYAHTTVTGTIYGAVERRDDKAEVQVIGSLRT
jgi:hypothetical protein